MKETQGIPKILNKIFKRGYMPSRSIETYRPITGLMVNCFGHACFNLEENDLLNTFKNINTKYNLHVFFRRFKLGGVYAESVEETAQCFKEKIQSTGLKVERSSLDEKLKDNQWKVAFFFREKQKDEEGNLIDSDFHFMLQTKSGFWTSKMGTKSGDIEVFKKIPKRWKNYTLQDIYKITNPYIENEIDEEKE